MDLRCWAQWCWSGGVLKPVPPHFGLWKATYGTCVLTGVVWVYNAELSGLFKSEIDPEVEHGGLVWISAAGLSGIGLVAGWG